MFDELTDDKDDVMPDMSSCIIDVNEVSNAIRFSAGNNIETLSGDTSCSPI